MDICVCRGVSLMLHKALAFSGSSFLSHCITVTRIVLFFLGLYDTPILVMDFNSLYPSIIQEFNICYTTVGRKSQANIADDNLPSMPSTTPEGILPQVIKRLVEQRKEVKKLLKGSNNDDRKAQVRQPGTVHFRYRNVTSLPCGSSWKSDRKH